MLTFQAASLSLLFALFVTDHRQTLLQHSGVFLELWIDLEKVVSVDQKCFSKEYFVQLVDLNFIVFHALQIVALFPANVVDHVLPLMIV